MITNADYKKRRNLLMQSAMSGILLLPANKQLSKNYKLNFYPFRQDSNFFYFTGIDIPDCMLLIDLEKKEEKLFVTLPDEDDMIWSGQGISRKEIIEISDISNVFAYNDLYAAIDTYQKNNFLIHFLPQYLAENTLTLSTILNLPYSNLNEEASISFIKEVVKLRSVKDAEEISEIERMVDLTHTMYMFLLKNIQPGVTEYELAKNIEKIAYSDGSNIPFETIITMNGEILHNMPKKRFLRSGRMVIADAGSESSLHYCSDITRTIPVDECFSDMQRNIYEIVLSAQLAVIKMLKPDISYLECHLTAAKIISQGLHSLGIMKGNINDIIKEGAYSLFFPHGIGHHLGLDAHDMESLGEEYVGYDDTYSRSDQFGLRNLRMAKKVQVGNILTVEPGIYFIPRLIGKWNKENKFKEFINYEMLESYLDFGGIRIEDDVIVNEQTCRILGKPIPKTIEEIENIRSF